MGLIEAMSADAIVALNLEAIQTFGGTHGILQEGCPDAIVALNLEAIQTFGGTHGILQEGCPERCTKNAELAEYYEGNGEADELGLTYISALMYYLIENHCFLDGNKRTGLSVGLHLLYEMGATLNATNEELVKMCEDVAEGIIPDRPALAVWLADRLIEDE